MTRDGEIIAARDRIGRLPVLVGRDPDGHCVSFESFAYPSWATTTNTSSVPPRSCASPPTVT